MVFEHYLLWAYFSCIIFHFLINFLKILEISKRANILVSSCSTVRIIIFQLITSMVSSPYLPSPLAALPVVHFLYRHILVQIAQFERLFVIQGY